jgi:hypothetical protein
MTAGIKVCSLTEGLRDKMANRTGSTMAKQGRVVERFRLQLYMWHGNRRRYLERHDFYVEQIKERVFSQFRDIEEQAKAYGGAAYESLCSMPGDENTDLADLAESAHDQSVDFYMMLGDLKKQVLLGALAGLYHQWDKDLRDFLEHELRHDLTAEFAVKESWLPNIGEIFDTLKEFGWDCTTVPFYEKIDGCRLIVNAYKHGKGKSLNDLAARFPEYLPNPIQETSPLFTGNEFLDPEWLDISETQFDELAAALRQFWEAFPERSYLESTVVESNSRRDG